MGCSSSVNHAAVNVEQPIKNCSLKIVRHESKIIQFVQAPTEVSTKNGDQKPKNQVILKKEQKIKQLKNNKEFIELSIETSYCVNKLLNTLAQNQMFQDQELKNLLSKNNQALAKKKNRYKNLEAREEKMELELKKQIEKNTSNRKTFQAKAKQMSQRKYNIGRDESLTLKKRNYEQKSAENKENKLYSSSVHLDSSYKSNFIKKIDKFRSQVNTLVPKSNFQC